MKTLILSLMFTFALAGPVSAQSVTLDASALERGPITNTELDDTTLNIKNLADLCYNDATTVRNYIHDGTNIRTDIQNNMQEIERKLIHLEYCKNAYDAAINLYRELINNKYDERL